MAKTFRAWDVEQVLLLPPSIVDFVPEGHPAHFVRETVRECLDLSAILESYTEERGYPPYDPRMMTALLLYAYTQGVYSSRRIARGCEERVDFMAITALQKPDFRTISDFRKRHLAAIGGLFVQVLELCRKAGLVKLGHVALDGTKIRANASKHKAMSYQRMQKAEQDLCEEVAGWLEKAEAIDTSEDAEHGTERRGDELPAWVSNKQQRLAKIREAKEALEAEAKRRDPPASDPEKPRRGRPRKHPPGVPKPSAQRNFTDPESRIMKTDEGFQQCYNAQAAVDASSQVIVACEVTQSATDRNQLKPMVEQILANTGQSPRELSADSDYCSEENLAELDRQGIRGYVATGKQQHGKPAPVGTRKRTGERTQRMQRRLKCGGYRSRYRLRKQVVEPVFGQAKSARGFRQFLLRGLEKTTGEWNLVCIAHNLLKLATATV
ncbi:MAG TPA: IS1182 family transposase [Thermoanaerobaculia bacterium]|nr:IS1182 family transposase [Thermoanaerobaculia bacterium]